MKKLFLIILILLLTGCYNYQEIENLAIVSSIAIDYQDDGYQIIFEIEETEDNTFDKSYLIYSKGLSINDAIQKRNETYDKTLYFANVDILLLTPNATLKLAEITDYINNDYHFAFNFHLALANNPEEIMMSIIDQEYIFGTYMRKLLKNPDNQEFKITYPDFFENYLNNTKRINLPIINISDKDLALSLQEVLT